MGEKKKRVTRLDRVRGMLVDLQGTAMGEKARAAIDGNYSDAIIHQSYETVITACLLLCDEGGKKGG